MKLAYWKFYLALALVLGGALALFWPEVGEGASSGLKSLMSGQDSGYQLDDSELAEIRAVRFEGLHNNASLLSVKSVAITGRQGSTVQLAVTLQSRSPDNGFPYLNILITGAGHERSVDYSPSEYSHGEKLEQGSLGVTVDVRPGERNFTVKPYYKAAQ